MLTLKKGCLAYFESTTSWLVPIKVLSIKNGEVEFEVTDNSKGFWGQSCPYPKGYKSSTHVRHVCPRGSVRISSLGVATISAYNIMEDCNV